MVENLTTKAVLKDALSSAATDIFNKLDQTVQNIGKNKPTEDAPLSYKVTHKGGALVRSGYETTSSQVHQLDVGETVTIVELVGRRARIITPVEGWVSTETKDGVQIMKPCTLQRKSTQNQAFEQMFEQKFNRLKTQSQYSKSGPGYDPRAERSERDRGRSPSYSPSPRSSPRGRDSDEDRPRGSKQGGQPSKGSAGSGDIGAFVPKLSAPGSKGGPTVLAPPPGQAFAAAPAGAPAAAASSSDFDLLSMGDSQPPAASAPPAAQPASNSNSLLDPFGDAPFAAAPAAPAAAAAPPATDLFGGAVFNPAVSAAPAAPAAAPAAGASDWAGFQGMGNAFNPMGGQQNAFNPMGGQQAASGYGVLGQAAPPQAAGMQAMGWGGAQGQMANAMGGAGGMQSMGMGMGGAMGQGGMGAGAMGGMFGGGAAPQQPGAWNAFGGGAPRPPAPQMQGQQGGMPAFGGYGMGGPAPGANNVDDLMSKAMQGVSNLSLDQRPAPQAPGGSGMPMNMMMGNR